MTINKRSKKSRYRGSHTHGGGHKKKRRGAGNRGGRGMAGTGAKGDAKKPSIWKNVNYFGKHGFKHLNAKKYESINIGFFQENIEKFLKEELIVKEKDYYIIDAKKLGFDKILGSGKITKKFKVSADFFSKKAEEKIKAAGGDTVKLKEETSEKIPAEEDN